MNLHNLQVIPPNLNRRNKQLFHRSLLIHSIDNNNKVMNDVFEPKKYSKKKFIRGSKLSARDNKIKKTL